MKTDLLSPKKLWLSLGGSLVFAACLLALFHVLIPPEPLLDKDSSSRLTRSRRGIPLVLTLAEDEQYRLITPLEDFPPELIEAVMLYEDRYFYYHLGINPWSILRAFWSSYIQKSRQIGGSTISMQTARLVYGIQSSTIRGKLKQMGKALLLEIRYSKDEILEAYLNLVPCGHNITGYPAASFIYFEKEPAQLSLTEILTLTVLPQNPNGRAPDLHHESEEQQIAKQRLADIWISHHGEDRSRREILTAPLRVESFRPFRAPHFVASLPGNDSGGYIETTLDWKIQRESQAIINSYLERMQRQGVKNCSLMVLQSQTMEVLAHIGSADFFNEEIEGQVDGVRARRSPGSTLKPFIYALALDQGLIHPQTILLDAPISFSEYSPDNYLSDFVGVAHAQYALTSSRNIPAISLASELEDPDLYDLLVQAGIPGLQPRDYYGLSLVLGSLELTMEELVMLYAALANGGHMQGLRKTLDDPYQSLGQLFSPQAAFIVLDMLMQNPEPVKGVGPSSPVSYKTGTSIGFKDCWSIAVMGDYIVAVWIGNFDGQENHHFLGRKMAAPLLFEILQMLDRFEGKRSWPPVAPRGLSQVEVCALSGGIPQVYCPKTVTTWFIPGVSPIDRCDVHRMIYLNAEGLQTEPFSPDHVSTEIREFWPSNVQALFKEAGLPRRPVPPFADELTAHTSRGTIPSILYPLEGVEYLPAGQEGLNQIPFQASADGDALKLFWFDNNRFLGTSEPGEILKMVLAPGEHEITAVDNNGRSSLVRHLVVQNY